MATKTINGSFEGYIWKSDQQAPVIYKGDNLFKDPTFNDEENPFTIEGQLYDRKTGYSVSIKYVDGEYLIKEYDKEDLKSGEVKDLYYKGNSKLKGNNLHFKEVWEVKKDKDPLCCNMEVLEPTKVIFAGFEKI